MDGWMDGWVDGFRRIGGTKRAKIAHFSTHIFEKQKIYDD